MRYKTYVGCMEGETEYESGSIWEENRYKLLKKSF